MLLGQYDYDILRILQTNAKTKKKVQNILIKQSDKYRQLAAGQFDKIMLQEKNKNAAILLALLAEFLNNDYDS